MIRINLYRVMWCVAFYTALYKAGVTMDTWQWWVVVGCVAVFPELRDMEGKA